jgi:cyclophilin family peptidyl-prolyl cis-trans isomerase
MRYKFLLAIVGAALLSVACVLETPTPEAVPPTEVPADTQPAGATATAIPTATSGTSTTADGSPIKQFINIGGVSIPQYSNVPPVTIDTTAKYSATIRTTMGTMVIDLFADQAPLTVNNFIFLAKEGYYDGIIFHRVIPSFMIQGGDPTGTGGGGPGYKFQDEIVAALTFDQPGRLAMANAGAGTNGSQFFVTTVATPHLNGNHTIFGQITQGQDIADAISLTETAGQDRPTIPVVIQGIDITSRP